MKGSTAAAPDAHLSQVNTPGKCRLSQLTSFPERSLVVWGSRLSGVKFYLFFIIFLLLLFSSVFASLLFLFLPFYLSLSVYLSIPIYLLPSFLPPLPFLPSFFSFLPFPFSPLLFPFFPPLLPSLYSPSLPFS